MSLKRSVIVSWAFIVDLDVVWLVGLLGKELGCRLLSGAGRVDWELESVCSSSESFGKYFQSANEISENSLLLKRDIGNTIF